MSVYSDGVSFPASDPRAETNQQGLFDGEKFAFTTLEVTE